MLRVVGLVILSLAVTAALVYGFVRATVVRQIVVDGQGMLIELDRSKIGENLLFLQTDRLTHDLLSAYPVLASVRFEKKYPGTLIIHLVRRQPVAMIRSHGGTYLVDADGIILDNAGPQTALPLMSMDISVPSIGSRVTNPEARAALTFINALHGSLPVTEMRDNPANASIRAVMGNTDIFLPQMGDLGQKASTLQTIVEGFRIKGTLPTVIDLRFDKPIVTN